MPRDPLEIRDIGAFTASSARRRMFPLVLISWRIAGPFWSRFHTQPPLKFRNVFSQRLKYYEAQHFGGKENDKWEKCGVFSLSERSHSHKKWTVCANSKR